MRTIGLIIFLIHLAAFPLQAQIEGDYPPITINFANTKVERILDEITRQTNLNFSYNPRSVDVDRRINFSVSQASLEETLSALADKINIRYKLIGGQIVLNRLALVEPEVEEYYTLSGFVEDQLSGESLIGATAFVPGTSLGAITNEFGFYSLPLKSGKHTLNYSYVGYEEQKMSLELAQNKRRDVAMQPTSVQLPDVIVGLPLPKVLDKKQLGNMELSPKDLNNMPEFGGESGLIKGLQSLPGIKNHSDGSAFFYVRGGERDQNVIIIDDAPIYNPSHLFGFYSIIIPDIAKSIQVYKSDMPANLGDRLSSIVSIRTKDGNLNRFAFSGALNPLINRFAIETPIIKKRGSILASLRGSNFEWLYKKANPNTDLNFGDFSFKWNHKLSDKDRIFFTTIVSWDNFTGLGDNGNFNGVKWGNLAATLRWNHIYSPKLFSNTTIYTGNYANRLLIPPNFWQSALGTLSLKSDFTHFTSSSLTSKFGLEAQAYYIDPGSFTLDTTVAILPNILPNYSRKLALYYQGEFDLTERLKLKAGLRAINWANVGPTTYHTYDDQYQLEETISVGEGVYHNYFHIDPRISLRYQLDSTSQLKLSAGSYHQYLQMISNSESPYSFLEVWLPAGPNIRPQSSLQLDLSYLKYFEKPKIELSAALYYKKFNHQIDYKPHAEILLNPMLDGELRFGSMQSYGLELFLKKEFGRLNGWIGYTLSRTIRKTPALNEGRTYPAFQDRPHDFSLMLNYEMAKRLQFSAYWTAYTGSTFSSPTGFYRYNDQTVPIFGEKNNDRLPAYRRLDMAFKFMLNKNLTQRFQHSLTFSVYNLLAHKNVTSISFNKIAVDDERPVVKANLWSETPLVPTQLDLIRFLPSLTYKFNL